ncbi:MAG: peptidoglycan-associated lipoprotein Pal [Alphaproteobacteria bacterium]|nr:peptidoglycan-associated lipoprotein Pal [Alphaproteobacteria bacterium]MBV9370194.1 peptidoglycan-associated lipoprotein Pal [Alphaproteobacteria bacterium]MBV9902413.1 peptidoglycan-associated lipoprotein Pal [Alphaproteobacteria bacterium]
MRNGKATIAAMAAALILAGCAKKPPKQLPPPAEETTAGPAGQAGGDAGGADAAAVPGSRADFLQSVGQAGDRIFFDTDQYDIDDRDRATLDQQAAWLRRYGNVRVTIEGHADERGTREYNLALGDRRANAAKNYLAAKGIDPSRMTVISWGKERPEALGSDESAWAQNRRAVTVLPD